MQPGFEPGASHARESADVAVIVPAHGRAEGLERCLHALRGQSAPAREIIVVDNGLQGGPERLRSALADVRVVTETRPGSYAARNRGIRETDAEIIAFTDDDCDPASDWLEEATRFLRMRPDVSLAAGAVEVSVGSHPPTPAELIELRLAFPQEAYVRESGFGVTANLVVRRSAFRDAGPFDPDLLSGGDFEWCRRAGAAGHRIEFVASARVRHPARSTAAELFRKERRVAGGMCQLVRLGRVPRRDYLTALLAAALPPVVQGAGMLRARRLAPLPVRLKATLLLAAARLVRLRALLGCMLRSAR